MVGEDEELSEIDSEEERRRRIMARKPTASHQDQFYPASQFKRKRSSLFACTFCHSGSLELTSRTPRYSAKYFEL